LSINSRSTALQIARRNIACVVDATADLPRSVDVAPENYLCVPILDGDAPSVEQLDKAAEFICRQLREKKAVLVHCGYGIGTQPRMWC
jgi:protein-tyrosine phosphatase